MLTLLTAIIVIACVATSLRRLRTAVAPTLLDPRILLDALRGDPKGGASRYERVTRSILSVPHADWEHALIDALRRPADVRVAFVNEQLTELDYRVGRWQSLPRVCARVCASAGFLFASLSLIDSLSGIPLDLEARDAFIRGAIITALDAASLGICGTAFCVAVAIRAQRTAKARLQATEKLVDTLERLADAAPDVLAHPAG